LHVWETHVIRASKFVIFLQNKILMVYLGGTAVNKYKRSLAVLNIFTYKQKINKQTNKNPCPSLALRSIIFFISS
jgi:hypothetical protein